MAMALFFSVLAYLHAACMWDKKAGQGQQEPTYIPPLSVFTKHVVNKQVSAIEFFFL